MWFVLAGCGNAVWVDGPVPNLVTAHSFELMAEPSATGTVTCVLVGGSETHRVAGSGGAALVVHGLLASSLYRCSLASSVGSTTRLIHTPPSPPTLPELAVEGRTDGYTLFNHFRDSSRLVLVDGDGQVRWYREGLGGVDYLTAEALGGEQILVGGSLPPQIVALTGEVLATAPMTSAYHHEATATADGSVFVLADHAHIREDGDWQGFSITRFDATLTLPLWSWTTDQALDVLPEPVDRQHRDLYHANALSISNGKVVVSLAGLSQLLAIDPGSGAVPWRLGRDGDFELLDADASGGWFVFQHSPKVSGNRVLLHDNGSEDRPYSRVIELELDEEAMTAALVWSFTEPQWYEPIWGDADWLDNGNVLITRGHKVLGDGVGQPSQVLEVDPITNEVVWRLRMSNEDAGIYRSQRIDPCRLSSSFADCGGLQP